MEVTLLYFDDCPNWQTTHAILRDLAEEFTFTLTHRLVTTDDQARQLGFRGSPTVHIDGVDPFADPEATAGLSCRIYRTPEGRRGSPTADMLRRAVTDPHT